MDVATHRYQDFTSLQSKQNLVVQVNLDGIVCIPGATVPLYSCSDIKIHDSSSSKDVTRSHYAMMPVSQCRCVPLAFPDKDVGGLASAADTKAMGRQLF